MFRDVSHYIEPFDRPYGLEVEHDEANIPILIRYESVRIGSIRYELSPDHAHHVVTNHGIARAKYRQMDYALVKSGFWLSSFLLDQVHKKMPLPRDLYEFATYYRARGDCFLSVDLLALRMELDRSVPRMTEHMPLISTGAEDSDYHWQGMSRVFPTIPIGVFVYPETVALGAYIGKKWACTEFGRFADISVVFEEINPGMLEAVARDVFPALS